MWIYGACFVAGVVACLLAAAVVHQARSRANCIWIPYRLQRFFGVNSAAGIQVQQRSFPEHVAPDVKAGLDAWLARQGGTLSIVGVPITEMMFRSESIASLLAPRQEAWLQESAVEYHSFDVGEEQTVECPQHALWLLDAGDLKLAIYWTTTMTHTRGHFAVRLKIEVGFRCKSRGDAAADQLFQELEAAVRNSTTYRGKVLSLESREDYNGAQGGVTVHKLRKVTRDDIVLAESTVALLERNLIRFVEQRAALRRIGMPTKKGLLLYGPPGTGKTHTIHYLVGSLPEHTTLLVTAEQLGRLDEYMTLARLFQPCLLVIEDIDLIAKARDDADVCQQSLLNRLLNEMDGLREDADILFLLTTNRPEVLEAALAARPGRVDQAVEFPLPDARCRERLMRVYACGASIGADTVAAAVRSTEGVSASFVKELMRRAIQFHLECHPDAERPEISRNDIDQALDELLFSSGQLNRHLLGAGEYPTRD